MKFSEILFANVISSGQWQLMQTYQWHHMSIVSSQIYGNLAACSAYRSFGRESIGDLWIPTQRAGNVEKVSMSRWSHCWWNKLWKQNLICVQHCAWWFHNIVRCHDICRHSDDHVWATYRSDWPLKVQDSNIAFPYPPLHMQSAECTMASVSASMMIQTE